MLEGAIVITTATEVPGFDERKGLSAAVAEALLWGADRGDRFETVPRYRGESSPRPAALSGDDRRRAHEAPGRMVHPAIYARRAGLATMRLSI